MSMKTLNLILISVVVTLIFTHYISQLSSQNSDKNLKIAVVNIKNIFDESKKAKAFEEQLEKERKEKEAELKSIEEQIKELEKEIDVLEKQNPNSPIAQQKVELAVQLSGKLEYRRRKWNNDVKKRINQNMAIIYNEIREVIDNYAKENNIDLVLKIESPRLETETLESANARINRRIVLYNIPSLDITKEIIRIYNEKFDKNK